MKTIYLLHTRPGNNTYPGVTIAFECRECAEIQASWYRRDKVPVTVMSVSLFESIRDGVMHECKHLQLRQSEHHHVPVTMGAKHVD